VGGGVVVNHNTLWKAVKQCTDAQQQLTKGAVLGQLEKLLPDKDRHSQLEKYSAYIDTLMEQPSCSEETFKEHQKRIREVGLRRQLLRTLSGARTDVLNLSEPLEGTLVDLKCAGDFLLRKAAREAELVEAQLTPYLKDLLTIQSNSIPTHSPWLNNILTGGLHGGKLYVLGAPPGAGKTTFCANLADYAAEHKFPVLFISYEMSKEQLITAGISRAGGINSALIEKRVWNKYDDAGRDTFIRDRLLEAAANYGNSVGENLSIVEAGPDTTAAVISGLVRNFRFSKNLPEDSPVLVVIDYMQLVPSGDEKLDNGVNETFRMNKVAVQLKQLARDNNVAVVAISDITKAAYSDAIKSGNLNMSALRESFKIAHAADVVMLLQTGKVEKTSTSKKGENVERIDQLELLQKSYADNLHRQVALSNVRSSYPLDDSKKACYARLSVLKNRSGMSGDVLFVYEKAIHRFVPVNLEITFDEEE